MPKNRPGHLASQRPWIMQVSTYFHRHWAGQTTTRLPWTLLLIQLFTSPWDSERSKLQSTQTIKKHPRAHLSDPPESFQENGDLCLISEKDHLRGCSIICFIFFWFETLLAHQQNPFSRWMWEPTTRILNLGMAAVLSTDSWLTFR